MMHSPIVISRPDFFGEEVKILHQLFEADLKYFHLRKPGAILKETEAFIQKIDPAFHARIVIHQHYELTEKFQLKGIHLTENARKPKEFPQHPPLVSTSFHRFIDILETALNFEYAFLSPILPSISKEGYAPELSEKEMKDFFSLHKQKLRFPIIALGGLTVKEMSRVRALGFQGFAFLGHIWQAASPLHQWDQIKLKYDL